MYARNGPLARLTNQILSVYESNYPTIRVLLGQFFLTSAFFSFHLLPVQPACAKHLYLQQGMGAILQSIVY